MAIDIGGTFTDIVVEGPNGDLIQRKVPSDPRRIGRAAIEGVLGFLTAAGVPVEDVEQICHGTTVTTNALIQSVGAKTALITTRGFRDVLEIGRLRRPPELLYGIHLDPPRPLVPRHLRFEVSERLDPAGNVLVDLDEREARSVIDSIVATGVEAIAVCLLFSYVDPDHERRLRDMIRAAAPNVYVALSSDIGREWREFERTATTAVAAFVGPVLRTYLDEMTATISKAGLRGTFHLMQSSGGLSSPGLAIANPATSLVSGPAAGVQAAAFIGRALGVESLISADMGGTSFDVGLVLDGRPQVTVDRRVAGHPIQLPMMDIETIGAGGGSIAWVDPAGSLRVGPRSAGARPGPACYAQGASEATVTDANLVLGYLSPRGLAGGTLPLDIDLARRALSSLRPEGRSMDEVEVASAIWSIVNANMSDAIRLLTIQRGRDPRDFALVPFGGAGPVHAAALAGELEIPWVIVPPTPGVTSAFGLLVADLRHDHVLTMPRLLQDVTDPQLEEGFRALERAGADDLAADGVPSDRQRLERYADLRYAGQGYVIAVPSDARGGSRAGLEREFHRRHRDLYGFSVEGEPVELVTIRIVALGLVARRDKARSAVEQREPQSVSTRDAFSFTDRAFVAHVVLERAHLSRGNVVAGPAIVQQPDSTTVIPHGWVATVGPGEVLVLGRTKWEPPPAARRDGDTPGVARHVREKAGSTT